MLSKIVEQSLQFEYYDGALPDDAPPGTTTGWRVLPFLMFSCSTDGKYVLHLKDQPDAAIGTGQGLLIPAGLTHKVDVGQRRAWGMWCHLSYTILGNVDVLAHLRSPYVLGVKQAKRFAGICLQLVTLHRKPAPNPLWLASRKKELGFQFLTHLIEISEFKAEHPDFLLRGRGLEPVLTHIQHHFADSLTIEDLARIACRSRSGFHQYFMEIMGKSPMEFVKELRLRSAQVLLAGSDLRVGEIAQRVGYPDQFHFSRVFKAAYAVSPKRFRMEQRQGLWSK